MPNLLVLGCAATAYGLYKLYRRVWREEEDHGTDGVYYSERDPSLRSSPSGGNTSDRNSGCGNNDPLLFQSERTQIRYYDEYLNVPTAGSSTTPPKRHGDDDDDASLLQSESSINNKSMEEETKQYVENLERLLKNFYKPKPSVPEHGSASSSSSSSSSKPFQSPSSSQSTSVQTPSALEEAPSSSSKPAALSPPLPLDSKNNQQTKGNIVFGQLGTSPVVDMMTPPPPPPKDNENLVKKNLVPEVLKTPLSQKDPSSSSKPTLSPPLLPDSTNQQKKASHMWVQNETSSVYKNPEDIEDLISTDFVPGVLPLSPSTYKGYFAPLLSDEDFDFELGEEAAIYDDESLKNNHLDPSLRSTSRMPSPSPPKCSPSSGGSSSSVYKIPKHIEDLIEKDIVPGVLKKPLSPSTYKDYFAALLYAEDFYLEKWSDFQLLNKKLELFEAAIYDDSLLKNNHLETSHEEDDKLFVAFKIENVPGRRPFLLSRDFVFAQRSGGKSEKFQGLLYRVVKSTTVLVEFEEDFYAQHHPSHRYDISFSFNRVCLKRAHQAIAAASDPLYHYYIFPECASRKSIPSSPPQLYCNYKLDSDIDSAVHQMLSIKGPPPHLVEGPLCVRRATTRHEFVLSKTGIVVVEAVLQIYQCSPESRILICAPRNITCDVLMENLMETIPESDMFRANAAFREVDTVPDDILQVAHLEGECFSCPSFEELWEYRVISSTFVSSFRLHDEGIAAGHFSHIFVVDASSAIEPEIMIALVNLANEDTTVIVTGDPYDCPAWVRSDIARRNGLKKSYFERLCQTETYLSCNPMFFTQLREEQGESDGF